MQVCQVTWWEGQQRCPAAREGAEPFSHTCPECRGQSRILSNPPPGDQVSVVFQRSRAKTEIKPLNHCISPAGKDL